MDIGSINIEQEYYGEPAAVDATEPIVAPTNPFQLDQYDTAFIAQLYKHYLCAKTTHWMTRSMAHHKFTDELADTLLSLIDEYMELALANYDFDQCPPYLSFHTLSQALGEILVVENPREDLAPIDEPFLHNEIISIIMFIQQRLDNLEVDIKIEKTKKVAIKALYEDYIEKLTKAIYLCDMC